LLDGIVSFERNDDVQNDSTEVATVDGSAEDLPTDPGARSFKLNDMLWNRITKFLQTRTFKFTLPLNDEGTDLMHCCKDIVNMISESALPDAKTYKTIPNMTVF
jgi:hypothetical protein